MGWLWPLAVGVQALSKPVTWTESWQVVVLTQPYLCRCRSPELFMSGHVSKASDIYVSVLERLCVTWL